MPVSLILDINWACREERLQCGDAWEDVFDLVLDGGGFLYTASSKQDYGRGVETNLEIDRSPGGSFEDRPEGEEPAHGTTCGIVGNAGNGGRLSLPWDWYVPTESERFDFSRYRHNVYLVIRLLVRPLPLEHRRGILLKWMVVENHMNV